MEPGLALGLPREQCRERAAELLGKLNIPERLWGLAPSTFSGGEQQRVNIARGFINRYPLLLLDEPTASLDSENRAVVVGLINEAKAQGSAVVGIFHDAEVKRLVADRALSVNTSLQEKIAC
ncbi:Alpha-D-ribose 1-methylphosphonate 5-triphosphate synthase subunit PhnL [compost metagenome]